MPDILTHLISADEALNHLSYDTAKTILSNRSIYNLGAQGPDLFFYHFIFPWQKTSEIEYLGSKIHQEKIQQFFLNSANIIKQSFAGDSFEFFKKKDLNSDSHKKFSYLAGFLTHYAMDIHCHPYIFYFSGHEGGYNHKYFECILDTLMNDIYDTKRLRLYKTGKAIKLNSNDRYLIAEYLSKILHHTYNESVAIKDIDQAMKDMKSTMNTMYDPKAIKRQSFRLADRFTGANGKIATAQYPATYDKKVDHLNLRHQEWCHPSDPNTIYTDSFLDCMKRGIKAAEDMITALSRYIVHQITIDEFKAIIGNKLYDTGLDASVSGDMTHSSPIVDYKKTLKIKEKK